ncbi:hypothetical protein F383_00953 [Gossypium arboreum]|uniref:Uncharacterized protein n=1 Tax=Gossypium arboreum TaxID=29729 RepID=A0A0B0NXL0_GOSAR|nr:hypothetical protein F383_00953 [Gossypium arboreum]
MVKLLLYLFARNLLSLMLTPSLFHFLIVPLNYLEDQQMSEASITLSVEALGIIRFIILNMACIGA